LLCGDITCFTYKKKKKEINRDTYNLKFSNKQKQTIGLQGKFRTKISEKKECSYEDYIKSSMKS